MSAQAGGTPGWADQTSRKDNERESLDKVTSASVCERREGEAPSGLAGGGGWSLPYKVGLIKLQEKIQKEKVFAK